QRRLTSTDGMLLLTVVLWALGIVVTKYLLDNGFQPLAYSGVRYGIATAIFLVLTYALERSLRVGGRAQLGQIAIAAFALLLNQVCFVYALKLTTATTVALMLGTMPVFAGLFGSLAGVEHMTRRFSLAAGVSFCGVALVAAGSGGDFSGELAGILVAVGIAATWAAYSVAIAPLMRSYSPYRISSVVLAVMWVPLVIIASPQIADQEFDLGWKVWASFAFAVVGPLLLTNVLWFTAVHRVGPGRASLFANLQPFLAAVFAVILLSEPLSTWQIGGGLLIGAGIFLAGRRETVAAPAE
ncbi:MAG: DMT family transporter, partial [Gaiellales bacterium]